jgi:hypothetical protein
MMSMAAKVGLALAGVGAVAVVASKSGEKKKTKTRRSKGIGGLKGQVSKNDPVCMAYPSGNWTGDGQVDGYPKGNPGWSPEQRDRIVAAVDEATMEIPPYEGMLGAREVAHEIIKRVFAQFCPSTKLPQERHSVENFKRKSLAFRHMWDSIDDLVWKKMTPGLV